MFGPREKKEVEEPKIKVAFTKKVESPEHTLKFTKQDLREILMEYALQNGVNVPKDAKIILYDFTYGDRGWAELKWRGY